ncbi:hypothetical protein K490DRAFT_30874 [Saccharata proteae CBS 121410]|uniref:SET domain-containing protein n=1 Tax=Saccharata proteae CBS 121410 TaxID=1314787 RepID=A0A9P4I3H9_9PEZI|nr:hypothetical protein K490DRAFT_30874 [Saccharata proteae CBS 121410]
MTELPFVPHAPPTPLAPFAAAAAVSNGRPVVDDEERIKCICGFEADDGSSVFCDVCGTWQHILCYYDSKEHVPDVHLCADCNPRFIVDRKRVTERQKCFRDQLATEKKAKRAPSKSHKKKVKDSGVVTNGHADPDVYNGTDRKSGSPRDQQPPLKRPKTNHKTSGSVASINAPAVQSRKRANSTAHPAHSPVKSPTTTIPHGYSSDYFSTEFLHLYQQSDYTPIEANSYSDLGLTNDLQDWLRDPQACKRATGKTRDLVFSRLDGPFQSLEATSPILKENVGEGSMPTVHGPHPTWKWITTESDIPYGGFIGELKGQIGRKEDYCDDPRNRWATLRHPEPFVFFPYHLPIYIDTRHEGTMLRYIRRSCRPNSRMHILISEESEYHFCLVATDIIPMGEEVTIPWELDENVRQSLAASLQDGNLHEHGIRGVEAVSRWVAGVLSNFGGCACKLPASECPLARADRRSNSFLLTPGDSSLKPYSQKRSRKNGAQLSPLSTGHATNSRAGSEARNRGEQDDDNGDSRSVSGSSRSKPTSRDITPMTHVSADANAGLGVEMSDREKRKLMQQEKLFEQLEHDEQHAQRKRKRNSAGQLGHPDNSTQRSRGTDATSRHRGTSAGQRSEHGQHRGQSEVRERRRVSQPKPECKDQSMQTEPDDEYPPLSTLHVQRRKPKGSFLRSLLHRAHDERIVREHTGTAHESAPNPPSNPSSSTPTSSARIVPTMPVISSPEPKAEEDTEMPDASTTSQHVSSTHDTDPISPTSMPPPPDPSSDPSQSSHPPLPPPPPPWHGSSSSDPGGKIPTPKKMSLSDWTAKRKAKAAMQGSDS